MAVPGFSGSDGGIGRKISPLSKGDLNCNVLLKKYRPPLDISYFINNVCNLRCKHCYVAYEENKNALSVKRWKEIFDELISMGALTFGNVGKEPTLTWEKTEDLLHYFKEKRESITELRFGIVSNGTLMDKSKIEELETIQPDYIDISIDSSKNIHDYIRGAGSYDKTISNLRVMSSYKLIKNVFVIFTANKLNISTIGKLIDILYNIGVKNFLISPYITLKRNDELALSGDEFVNTVVNLLAGKVVDFGQYKGIIIYIKNDYTTTRNIMEAFVNRGIINKGNLFIDEYGIIFNKYTFNGNKIIFNYLPWDNTYVQAIRISHDGYVSNCFDMFFPQYPERAIGNVRMNSINKLLHCDTPQSVVANL